jgi:hypothetical protein
MRSVATGSSLRERAFHFLSFHYLADPTLTYVVDRIPGPRSEAYNFTHGMDAAMLSPNRSWVRAVVRYGIGRRSSESELNQGVER